MKSSLASLCGRWCVGKPYDFLRILSALRFPATGSLRWHRPVPLKQTYPKGGGFVVFG